MIQELHHIQIAIPRDGEPTARTFYCGVLGFREEEKPEQLRARGGLWLRLNAIRLHLGVAETFVPAQKAHPGFRVHSLAETRSRLTDNGVEFREDIDLPGMKRVYVSDPFGNRIELLELSQD